MKKPASGFTLIELLVVISIISFLSSIIMVSLNSTRAKGRDAKRLIEKKQVVLAMNGFYSEKGSWPDTGGAFKCLAPTAETCWGASVTGLNSLGTDLSVWLSSFPINNADAGTAAYNRLLYSSFLGASALGAGSQAGAYIIWIQEKAITSVDCPGPAFLIQHYDKYYYCYEFLGSP